MTERMKQGVLADAADQIADWRTVAEALDHALQADAIGEGPNFDEMLAALAIAERRRQQVTDTFREVQALVAERDDYHRLNGNLISDLNKVRAQRDALLADWREVLMALDAARRIIKGRDQDPHEMRVLDALKIACAIAERHSKEGGKK